MTLNIAGIDVAIVFAYLAGMVLFGMWVGRGQKNIADYLLSDRDLPMWLVLLSIVSTETSAASFLSVPGVAYAGDMAFLQLPLGYVVGRYVVVWLLLPQYFGGQMYTAYEVLAKRFGGATKRAASLMFIVMRTAADGMRLFLAGIVLKAIVVAPPTLAPAPTGPPATGAIAASAAQAPAADFDVPLAAAVVVMGVATIVYTFVGGMKAVVWTDAIQFFIYVPGALLAFFLLIGDLDQGWTTFMEFGRQHDKFRVFDFDFDLTKTYTFWAGLFGGAFLTLGSHGADQLNVQRYLSARSQRDAGRAIWLSGWIVLAQFALFLLLGVGLAAFYHGKQSFASTDAVFTQFIVQELPIGVRGVVLAAVFAAAITSSLNSIAAVAVTDLYIPLWNPQAGPAHELKVTRWLTVLFGVAQIGVGIYGQFLGTSVVNGVLAIAGFTTGITLGIFFLGVLTKHVDQRAALIAFVTGLTGMTVLKFHNEIGARLGLSFLISDFQLAWPWYVLVGSVGTVLVGVAAAAILPTKSAA